MDDGNNGGRETLAGRTIRLYADHAIGEGELMAYLKFSDDVYELTELRDVKARLRYCWFRFVDGSRVRLTLKY